MKYIKNITKTTYLLLDNSYKYVFYFIPDKPTTCLLSY